MMLPFAILLVILIAVIFHRLWLPSLYHYLDVSQPPRSSDIIITLGGGNHCREQYAVELYNQGYAPFVLVSGNRRTMANSIKLLENSEIPLNAMLINDQATSTYDEAQQVLAMVIENNAQSVLIVTNRYHTRRAMATYKYVFGSTPIRLNIAAPDDGISDIKWWQSSQCSQIVLEFIKMPYYWLAYAIWSG